MAQDRQHQLQWLDRVQALENVRFVAYSIPRQPTGPRNCTIGSETNQAPYRKVTLQLLLVPYTWTIKWLFWKETPVHLPICANRSSSAFRNVLFSASSFVIEKTSWVTLLVSIFSDQYNYFVLSSGLLGNGTHGLYEPLSPIPPLSDEAVPRIRNVLDIIREGLNRKALW